jgi:NAD(P)-dependent dehydrogenase (short-subunit alcohol dehydrogenase family)
MESSKGDAMADWTKANIPTQRGRTAVVTGTGGLGYETGLELARAGCEVIVAGRDARKGVDAVARIRAETSMQSVRFEQVDLAELQSVREFGSRLRGQLDRLDLLINNAAVMRLPQRRESVDGFEMQFATNYLGHFALTAQLMPLLCEGRNARVVTLSSIAARGGKIDFENLQGERAYEPMEVYSQSKLACLMFAFELQRRSEAGGWGVSSMAAHPGISRTELLFNGPGRWSANGVLRQLLWFLFQPAPQGALPTLFAATAPEAEGGGYYGPDKMSEIRGHPVPSRVPAQAMNLAVAERLWHVSEELTRTSFAAMASQGW